MSSLDVSLRRLNSSRPAGVLLWLSFITYGIFLVGYFLFPDFNDQYRFFVRFVVFPGVLFIVAGFLKLRGNRLFQLTLVYLLFMVASGLWSQPFDLYRFGQMIATSVYITGFVVLTYVFYLKFPTGFDRALKTSAIVAAISIPVALVSWYGNHAFPLDRVEGLGSLTNTNEFSNVYGVFGLLAASWALKTSSIYERLVFVLVVVLCVAFMWFGQSRTSLASFLTAILVLAVMGAREHKALIGLALIIPLAALMTVFPDLVELALARGASLRPFIWEKVLSQVAEAPILGHGLVAEEHFGFSEGREFATAHNAYLQATWHGGVVGFGLLMALLVMALRNAWSAGKETGDYVLFSLFVFVSLCMMTGVDALIARPRDQWMLFWFPLALLISYQVDRGCDDTGKERVSGGI